MLSFILGCFSGVGLKNDIVSVRPNFARKHLLLNGLAVYASPENLEKLKLELAKRKEGNQEELLQNSSRFAELVIQKYILDHFGGRTIFYCISDETRIGQKDP